MQFLNYSEIMTIFLGCSCSVREQVVPVVELLFCYNNLLMDFEDTEAKLITDFPFNIPIAILYYCGYSSYKLLLSQHLTKESHKN